MQPSTFKALQITKISKLSLLSLPPLFFNRRERQEETSKSKSKFISPPGKQSPTTKLVLGIGKPLGYQCTFIDFTL